jgi:hypothetical protein
MLGFAQELGSAQLDLAPGYSEGKQKERTNPMSQDNKNRVLGRRGAHELNKEQTEAVLGGFHSFILTNPLTNPDVRFD